MIYLVGVNHGIQYLNDGCDVKILEEFKEFIFKKIDELNIKLIAEEINQEALINNNAKSFVEEITKLRKIEYLMCDFTTEERKKLLINNDGDREFAWINKIKDHFNKNIIFICGYDHLNSFYTKLKSLLETKILSEKYWGEELDPITKMNKWLKEK